MGLEELSSVEGHLERRECSCGQCLFSQIMRREDNALAVTRTRTGAPLRAYHQLMVAFRLAQPRSAAGRRRGLGVSSAIEAGSTYNDAGHDAFNSGRIVQAKEILELLRRTGRVRTIPPLLGALGRVRLHRREGRRQDCRRLLRARIPRESRTEFLRRRPRSVSNPRRRTAGGVGESRSDPQASREDTSALLDAARAEDPLKNPPHCRRTIWTGSTTASRGRRSQHTICCGLRSLASGRLQPRSSWPPRNGPSDWRNASSPSSNSPSGTCCWRSRSPRPCSPGTANALAYARKGLSFIQRAVAVHRGGFEASIQAVAGTDERPRGARAVTSGAHRRRRVVTEIDSESLVLTLPKESAFSSPVRSGLGAHRRDRPGAGAARLAADPEAARRQREDRVRRSSSARQRQPAPASLSRISGRAVYHA